jgi:hypothetical protein
VYALRVCGADLACLPEAHPPTGPRLVVQVARWDVAPAARVGGGVG